MTHRLNFLLLMLAALFGLPFYWLLLENPARDVAAFPVSISQLRTLANSIPGPRPEQVEMAVIGTKRTPGNLYAAGSGMKRRVFAVLSFRLPVAGQGPVIIDTGTTRTDGRAINIEQLLDAQQARLNASLASASLVVATSERPLHLGDLAASTVRPDAAAALAGARLNGLQVGALGAGAAAAGPNLRPAITGSLPIALAPGVVVIPTGAPSPGSQLVYVRLASGREYVFAGDVAPFGASFTELRVRSNLLDRDVPSSLRQTTMRWLVTLRALNRQAPGLTIIPGHDFDWIVDPAVHSGVQIVEL